MHSDNWFAVAILAILGQIRRTPIIVKNGRVVGATALQARASLENSLQVVWSWLGHDACSAFSRTLPKAPVVEFSTAIRARMRPPFRPVSFTSIPSSANSSTIWLKSSGLSHRSCCLSVTAYCLPHFLRYLLIASLSFRRSSWRSSSSKLLIAAFPHLYRISVSPILCASGPGLSCSLLVPSPGPFAFCLRQIPGRPGLFVGRP